MYRAALKHTAGVVSYPVDDAFIHLAIAKRLALEGVFAVSGHEFTGASSSIGWPLVLALVIKVVGAHAYLPLAVNVAFGIALPFVVDRAALRLVPDIGIVARLIVGLGVVVLTPMPTVIVLGMEHTAHIVAHIAFVTAAVLWLPDPAEDAPTNLRATLRVAALAAFVTLWRYEGIFPIFLVCLLAGYRRRWRSATIIGGAGAVPILAFGLYSKAHGSLFLPVPVVLKGRHFDWHKLGDVLGVDLMDRFGTEAPVLVIAVACAILGLGLVLRSEVWTPRGLALTTTLAVVFFHVELASLGWFYRYESYLLASGIAFAGIAFASFVPSRAELVALVRRGSPKVVFATCALLLLAMPLRRRAVLANDDTPAACRNIYEQQIQSARFLARFGDGPVAINDIGAVAWLGDEPIVDLVGLANLPVARAKGLKLDQPLRVEDIERFTPGVKVAIVYDEWFKDTLPPSWLRVGRWRIEGNKSCAFPIVSIYATEPASYPTVIEALRRFAPELPRRVVQLGRYLEHPGDANVVRPGDEVVIDASARELSGSYTVDETGSIMLANAGNVFVAGKDPRDVRDRITQVLGSAPTPPAGGPDVRRATLRSVVRLPARKPRVQVAGRVARSVETSALTLPTAVASAGGSLENEGAWVWRERAGGFVRLGRAELEDDALVDGDIVVVGR